MSLADGDDEDLMGVAPLPESLEDHVLQIAQERPGCSLLGRQFLFASGSRISNQTKATSSPPLGPTAWHVTR